MKWILVLWAVPLTLLLSWYGLSYYDINFGTRFFSRDLHDLVFIIYGHILGVSPDEVPILVARAIVVDTAIVFGLVYWRTRRKRIRQERLAATVVEAAQAPDGRASEASLSSAP